MNPALELVGAVISERLSTLLFALLLVLLLGGPLRFYRALSLTRIGGLFPAFIRQLEAKLNRKHRSSRERQMRGAIIVFLMMSCAMYVGTLLERLPASFETLLLHIFILAVFIPARALLDQVLDLARLLSRSGTDIAAARNALGPAARRDVTTLDMHGIARASIENLAIRFTEHVISPAFWYLIFGIPGVLMVRVIASMHRTIGIASPRLKDFGWCTALFARMIHFIPSRITAILLCLASFFSPLSYPGRAWRTMFAQSSGFILSYVGLPVAAMAGALKLSLGGPRKVENTVIEDGWIGDGTPKATVRDMKRALILYALSTSLLMLLMAATLLAFKK